MQNKTLILKTGYSEVLDDRNNSRKVSLGDVLRTTPLLHLYQGSHVTWVTDEQAIPLLEGNPLISRILPYDFTTAFQLRAEEFDRVINLEKTPGICALSDSIRARRSRYGFTFNSQTGEAEAYDQAYNVLAVGADPRLKKKNRMLFQDLLFEMVGEAWGGEEYVLGYAPQTAVNYDVALNTQIGQKWRTKAWPEQNWDALEQRLVAAGLKVTRQDKQDRSVLTDLRAYMDWLNSSRLIITNDSLGLHLGIALKKKMLGLFGPTPSAEVCFYGLGKAIGPEPPAECVPCFSPKCNNTSFCMDGITAERVYEEARSALQ